MEMNHQDTWTLDRERRSKESTDKTAPSDASIRIVEEEAQSEIGVIGAKTILVLLAANFVYGAQNIAIIGAGILASPMSILVGGTDKAVWFTVLVNLLTVALSAPLGQTSDYWGRRWILVILSACGFVGSIIISRGQNIATLIAGFAVMSINFGGISLIYAITSEVLPRKYRALGQAFQQFVSSSTTIAGLLMGTSLVNNNQLENFRIYWYLTAGLFGASALGLYFGYTPPPRELELAHTWKEKVQKLDWVGIGLFVPGLVLFSIALAWTDNPYHWNDSQILAPFIISILILSAFGIYEWRFKDDGIFHHELINRNFIISCLVAFNEGLSFFTANSYFVLEAQVFYNRGTFTGSFPYLVLVCAAVVSVCFMGVVSVWWKTVRAFTIFGIGGLVIFNACMASLRPTHSIGRMMGFAAIGGAGDGVILPAILTVSQLSTPPELIALTSAMIMTIRCVGGTVGPVINLALYNNAMSQNLVPNISAAILPLGFPKESLEAFVAAITASNPDTLASLGATEEVIAAGSAAFVDTCATAFRNLWLSAAAFATLGLLASFFLVSQKHEFSDQVDASVEKTRSQTRP